MRAFVFAVLEVASLLLLAAQPWYQHDSWPYRAAMAVSLAATVALGMVAWAVSRDAPASGRDFEDGEGE